MQCESGSFSSLEWFMHLILKDRCANHVKAAYRSSKRYSKDVQSLGYQFCILPEAQKSMKSRHGPKPTKKKSKKAEGQVQRYFNTISRLRV